MTLIVALGNLKKYVNSNHHYSSNKSKSFKQCYPFAAHFLCSWGVACQKEQHLDNNGLPLLPCRDYCDEFMSNCGHKLPRQIKDKLKCGGEWNGVGSCITKPGCVQSLYETGQKQRICDGVMDCM